MTLSVIVARPALRRPELSVIEGMSAFYGGDIATATVVLIAVASFIGFGTGSRLAWIALRIRGVG